MKSVKVYDIETLASLFTYTDIDVNTKEINVFVIHKHRNECYRFIDYIKTKVSGMVGFNNLDFDYPVIHKLIKYIGSFTFNQLIENLNETELAEHIIEFIYNTSQQLINSQNSENKWEFKVKEKDFLIPQLDLFKLWHYNNKARSTSLKSLEIAMNYPNVMDMPIEHSRTNITLNEIDEILEYNLNDVLATFEFYKKSAEKINLRKELFKKYNLKCLNYSDSKIGEELMLKLYCSKTGLNYWDVKKLRTERSSIPVKDCIFDYIKFDTDEFKEVLNKFNNFVVSKQEIEEKKNTKKKKLGSCIYKGFKYDFGLGGIHGCIASGVYENDEDYLIVDADVGSLYPNIAIENGLYPEHLGPIFCKVYKEDIIDVRMMAKEAGDMVISDGFKLAANSVYGKSKDKFSFLYDPLYTLKTTINGQLMISMLCEQLISNIENIIMLQVNTDGLTVKIHKSHMEQYYEICKKWEQYTNLKLEYAEYSKMIIADVNNYIAVTTKGKIKQKGRLEVDKVVGNEPAYHKNNSFKIIPIALNEYFVNNIPIETTIMNHDNIYNFCGRQKFKGNDYGEIHYIDENGNFKKEIQQKNTRYYISSNGSTFIKQYAKGTQEFIHVGNRVTIFNKYIENDYKIDYQFYIRECNKEIRNIVNTQLSLF